MATRVPALIQLSDPRVAARLVFFKSQGQLALPSNCPNSRPAPLYTLNGEVIKEVDSVRYLGYIIINDGKDDKDKLCVNANNYMPMAMSLRKFHMCPMDVKVKLFNTYSLLFTYIHCATVVEPHCIQLSTTKCLL